MENQSQIWCANQKIKPPLIYNINWIPSFYDLYRKSQKFCVNGNTRKHQKNLPDWVCDLVCLSDIFGSHINDYNFVFVVDSALSVEVKTSLKHVPGWLEPLKWYEILKFKVLFLYLFFNQNKQSLDQTSFSIVTVLWTGQNLVYCLAKKQC